MKLLDCLKKLKHVDPDDAAEIRKRAALVGDGPRAVASMLEEVDQAIEQQREAAGAPPPQVVEKQVPVPKDELLQTARERAAQRLSILEADKAALKERVRAALEAAKIRVTPDVLRRAMNLYAQQRAEKEAGVQSGNMFFQAKTKKGGPDAKYAAALEAKDLDAAQKLVDAAAKKAGWSTDLLRHGTTHEFRAFTLDRANIENQFGKGFYFTNSEADAAVNYAGEGPDLTNRIAARVDQLRNEGDEDEVPSPEEAEAQARRELAGETPRTLNVYVKLANPAIIGGKGETFLDYAADEAGNESGKLLEFVQALREVASEYDAGGGSVDEVIAQLAEKALDYDGIGLRKAEKILKEADGGIAYATDPNTGSRASSEIIRTALERIGFDGIIDRSVNEKFGSEAKLGRPMEGVGKGTVHVIAFKPASVKSADPVTYDEQGNVIPLSKRFDETKSDMYYQDNPSQDPVQSAVDKLLAEDQRSNGMIQGAVSFDEAGAATIKLMRSSADLSTFAHEVHHVLLRDLENLIASGNADATAKADLQTIRDFAAKKADTLLPQLKASLATAEGDRKAELAAAVAEIEAGGADFVKNAVLGTAAAKDSARVVNVFIQETSARAWEAYLREGKAPSVELASTFMRFKQWLKAVYQSLEQLGMTGGVPEDLRAVFDRMLASDEEIEQARTYYEGVQEFSDLINADEEEKAKLSASRKAADDASEEDANKKVVSAYMRAQGLRAKMAEQAKKDVAEDKVQDVVRQIKDLGGISSAAFDGMTLSEADVAINALRRHGESMVRKGAKTGWDTIAQAAEAFGYPSEEAFLDAIANAPTFDQAVKARTEALLAQEEQNILASLRGEEGALPGDESYHVEPRLVYLVAQAQMLRDRASRQQGAQQARINANVVKQAAWEAISSLPLKSARYDIFARAEARFARLAKKALKAGDFAKASLFMDKQVQNHAMAAAALQAREEATKLERSAKKLGRLDPKKFEYENREAALWLISSYGLADMAPEKPEAVNIGLMLAEEAKDGDASFNIPDWVYQTPKPYKELSLDDLRVVVDSIRQIAALGKKDMRSAVFSGILKKVMGVDGDLLIEDAAVALALPMAELKDRLPLNENHPLFGVQAFGRKMVANLSLIPLLAKEMDAYAGFGPNGKMGPNEAMMRATAECASGAMTLWSEKVAPHLEGKGELAEGFRAMRKRLEGVYGGRFFDIKDVPLTNDPELMERYRAHGVRQWTAERLFMTALNLGNQGNVDAMVGAFGWDELQVETLIMQLTSDEWTLVQKTWELVNQFYAPMDDVHFRINDVHTKKVEALPRTIVTADGKVMQIQGGYFPLTFDQRLSDKAGKHAEEDLMKNRAAAVHRTATVQSGFAKSRTGGKLPVKLDLSVLYEHLQDVIHYTTHAELVKDTDRLTKDSAYSSAVRRTFGVQMYNEVREWVKSIARPETGPTTWLDQLLTRYRHLTTVYALGLNLKSAVKQLTALTTVAQDIGWGWTLHGMKTLIARRGAAVDAVRERSIFVRDREKSIDREVSESLASSLKPDAREVEILGRRITKRDVLEFAYTFITAADRVCVVAGWEGAYQKALYEGKTDAEARGYADDTVANSQPSARRMDLSHWQRGQGAERMLSQFMSWTVKYGHRTRAHLRGWREGKLSTADYTRHVMNEQLLPILGLMAVNELWKSVVRKRKKDEDKPVWEDFFLEGLSQILSGYPILNRIPSAIQYGERGLTEAPPLKPLILHYKTGKALAGFFDGEKTAGEDTEAFLYALAQSASLETGIPWLNIARDLRGAYNAVSGEEPKE